MYGYCGTEAEFAKWLQSALRGGVWASHPSKVTLIKQKRVMLQTMQKNGKMKGIFHVQCYDCKGLFKLKDIEVNHKKNCGGLSDLSKLHSFVDNLLLVQPEDLELLCHDCHSVVTYMERMNVSKRDAIIEKKCIAFYKLPIAEQMEKCKKAGFDPIPKTKIGRKNMVREYLKKALPQ